MFVMSPPDRPDMVVVGGLMHYEELKPYVAGRAVVGMRSNGRAVLMSMDAGATWTDMTGDVGGESMHPDQHAIAFVPGQPGSVLRRLRRRRHPHERQVGRRVEPVRHAAALSPADLADCHAWLKQIPTELHGHERRTRDAADEQHLRQPVFAEDTAMTGTQDNGTLVVHRLDDLGPAADG